MPSSSPEKHSDQQTFLRTEPGSALHARASQASTAESGPSKKQGTVFPAPAPPEAITVHLREWPVFTALAVHTDAPAADDRSTFTETLAGCLESTAANHLGIWFEWTSGLYGLVFPGLNIPGAEAAAHRIQAELATTFLDTISVGISTFPQLDFSSLDTLQNACKALDHAAFFGPGHIVAFDAVSLNISGDYFYQADRLEAAIVEYRAALHLDPNLVNVHNSLGICLSQTGDHDAARAAFEAARELDPNEAMVVYNLGVLCLLENMPEEALEWFHRAFALDTRTFEIPFQIGRLLSKRKAWAEAIPYLEKAIQIRAASGPAHTLLGRCRASLGQTHPAIAAYQRAVKINPYDAAALSALGSLYDVKGENPEICVTFCRQSVAISPDNGLYRLRLARLYHKHNQLERALAEYESATALGCDASHQIADIQEQLTAGNKGSQCCA